jgi:hypothetical protein
MWWLDAIVSDDLAAYIFRVNFAYNVRGYIEIVD